MDRFEDHKIPKHQYHNKNVSIYSVGFLFRNAVGHDGSMGIHSNDNT